MTLEIRYIESPIADEFCALETLVDYHAYMALTGFNNESSSYFALEEMHFRKRIIKIPGNVQDTEKEVLLLKRRSFKQEDARNIDISMSSVIESGPDLKIRNIWDNACLVAEFIDKSDIPYNHDETPECYNCRAAIIAILEALSLGYKPVIQGLESGINADIYQRYLAKANLNLGARSLNCDI